MQSAWALDGVVLTGHAAADAQAPSASPTQTQTQTQARSTTGPREVMFIGNNWAGTANIVDARTFKKIGRLNIIPDYAERMAEIESDPVKLGYFLAIRQLVVEGHDQ